MYMISKHKSTKLNISKYYSVSLTIQLNFTYLFIQSFKKVLYEIIQFSISYLFAFSLNVK